MMKKSHRPARALLTTAAAAGLLAMAACASGGGASTAGGGSTPASPASALGERASFEGLSFQVPHAWKPDTPSSSMRLAQYRLDPAAGDAEGGECSLFHFPGTGGSVQANLQRWYGQFSQPDGGNTADRAKVESFRASDLPVTLVQVTGTYSGGMGPGGMSGGEPKPGYGMVAGVVETQAGPWFLKCTGPQATMAATAPDVRALLQTAKP